MRVDVDETGSERQAVEVDDLGVCTRFQLAGSADRGNPIAGDGDLRQPARSARSVDQPSLTQQQIHGLSDRRPAVTFPQELSKYSLTYDSAADRPPPRATLLLQGVAVQVIRG